MCNIYVPNVFMRSVATRIPYGNIPNALPRMLQVLRSSFDMVIVETPGTGQVLKS